MLPRVQHCCYGDSLESSDGEALLVSHVLQKNCGTGLKKGMEGFSVFFLLLLGNTATVLTCFSVSLLTGVI